MKNIQKAMVVTSLLFSFSSNLITANQFNLDEFFGNDDDVTEILINDMKQKKKKQLDKIAHIKKNNVKYVIKENTPPKIYFKQPRVYTIYTREELRTFENVEMIINSGWKTIIVGQHQLVINDEMKIK